MSDYPNLEALAQGCVSGKLSDWSLLRPEAKEALIEIEQLQKQVTEAENIFNLLDRVHMYGAAARIRDLIEKWRKEKENANQG